MEQLTIFTNEEFGQVRTIEEDGKVLFCGKDIATALGYTNPHKAIRDHCKGVTKRSGVSYTTNQHGKESAQVTEMNYIPESDVYRLIVRSKLPSAKKFERWVFEEVMPSIREKGCYTSQPIDGINALLLMMEQMNETVAMLLQAVTLLAENSKPTPEPPLLRTAIEEYTLPINQCKMETFPICLRKEVEEMMIDMQERSETNYSAIARYCTLSGFPISSPSVKTYYNRFFQEV